VKRTTLQDQRDNYTIPQVADILGIDKASARRAVKSGEIPSTKIGRRTVIERQALLTLVATRGFTPSLFQD